LYNPAPLIQGDMLQTVNVQVAVVIKHYDDGRILASIRCNQPAPVAADLAVHFGGGGHPHAAGFKIENGRPLNEVKSECIRYCSELISKLDLKDARNETIQHSF
jgi:nanoRNase/pAp phosphatase (c-di-AMP/oligoRNAs hydrolase)